MYIIQKKYKDTRYFYLCESIRDNDRIIQKVLKKFKDELPDEYKKYYLPKVEKDHLDFLNSIYHGDCFELMKHFREQDFKVDLILTDPPYNISQEGKLTKNRNGIVSLQQAWGNEYDDNKSEQEMKKWLKLLARNFFDILKDDGSCILFFARGKAYLLEEFYNLFKYQNSMVFIKTNPLPHIRKNNYRSGFEQCFWFSKSDKYCINFLNQKDMVNVFSGSIGGKKTTSHPNEKYLWMIEPLIKRHSKKGDIVFDPFAGSGVVAELCRRYKRKYILCEQNRKYLIEAKNRIPDD